MGVDIKVKYYIPEDIYQYSKLTYKQGKAPESVNDGTIVNLDPTLDEITVESLDAEQTYYFTIYTDKSESESKNFYTGEEPEPETNDIIVYKNGRIRRSDSIISDSLYITSFRLDTATVNYESNSIELIAANSTYTDGTLNYGVDFNLKSDSSQSVPLISTVSQNYYTRTKTINKVKVKFDFKLTMEPGSLRILPKFCIYGSQNGSNYSRYAYISNLLTDLTHVSGNYICADASASFTISESLEATILYYDYNTGSSFALTDQYPHLWLELGASSYSGSSVFNMKINIKEIAIEMNPISYPKSDDGFYIQTTSSSRIYKTISEIYEMVKDQKDCNAFILTPVQVKSSITEYLICPMNIEVPEDLYIGRDFYLTRIDSTSYNNSYFAIGYKDMPLEYSATCYNINTSTGKLMTSATMSYGNYTETRDGITYKFARRSTISNSNATSYIFYTEGYKRLYVNNVLIHEKKT